MDTQNWSHNVIIEAEDLIEEKARETHEIIAGLEHIVSNIQSQGEGPNRIRQRLIEIQDKLDLRLSEPTEYALATTELHGYVSRVMTARGSVYEAAAGLRETIPESGYVVTPPMEMSNSPDRYEKYRDLHTCIKSMVSLAAEAKTTIGPRFKALADDQYTLTKGCHSESVDLANDANPSWAPEEVSVQWRLLSDSKYETFINGDPEKYGNLDGIDIASRTKVDEPTSNRYFGVAGNRVPGLLKEAQKEYGEAKAVYERDKDSSWGSQCSDDEGYERPLNAHDKLNDLEAIREALGARLDDSLGDDLDISLISLEYGEPGKSVLTTLAIGDVDSAGYVTTLVPSMTTSYCDSIALDLSYASNLRGAVVKAGADRGDVATIAWLGYDAPPALPDPSVTSTAQTEVGVVSLRSFIAGAHFWCAGRGLGVCRTGIIHSYGLIAGGVVMRGTGKDVVNGFAYTGSSGAGVAPVGALSVDKGRVWMSAIPHHDIIQGVRTGGGFGLDPRNLKDVGHLPGDASGAKDYSTFGPNPVINHLSYFVAPGIGKGNYAPDGLDRMTADAKER